MTLGEKIRQARLAAGLSQRQLCGDTVTRNMLSQIENGTARPSMTTLQIFAGRLGKPISYFLEEDVVVSPSADFLTHARAAFREGDFSGALDALTRCDAADPVFAQEILLLGILARFGAARQAINQGKEPYATKLLTQAREMGAECLYYTDGLERERLLLLAESGQENLSILAASLPSCDRELLLLCEAALLAGDLSRAAALLDSCQIRDGSRWHLLRGEVFFAGKDYAAAAEQYSAAENAFPRRVWPRLEICWRELQNYQKAYEYALKQR